MDLDGLTERLRGVPGREDSLTHLEVLPARDARTTEWPAWLGAPVRAAVQRARRTPAMDAPARGGRPRPRPVSTWSSARAPRRASRCATCCRGCTRSRRLAARRDSAARRCSTSRRPRPWRRTSWPPYAASGCPTFAAPPTTATRPPSCASGRATTASTSSPTPTCSTTRCCPATPAGTPSSARCATSWSTSATTTAACSAPMSPRSCAGCGGWRRCTAPTRPSCWPRPPSRSRRSPPARLTGLDVVAVTDDGSPRGRTALALWEPPFVARPRRERRSRPPGRDQRGGRPAHRPGHRAGAHARLRPLPPRRGDRGARRTSPARRGRRRAWSTRWRPTAAATCPRSGASSRRRCAAGGCSASRRPTPSSSASTSAASTPSCSPASPAPGRRCGSRSAGPVAGPARRSG